MAMKYAPVFYQLEGGRVARFFLANGYCMMARVTRHDLR